MSKSGGECGQGTHTEKKNHDGTHNDFVTPIVSHRLFSPDGILRRDSYPVGLFKYCQRI